MGETFRYFKSYNSWIFLTFIKEISGLIPGVSLVKNPPASAGGIRDMGSITGLGRAPEEGNGNPLQDSCLRNLMDRGAWRAIVHGVTKELDMT